jgi:Fungal specific transcription factor domain
MSKLCMEPDNTETCALAYSVCAATGAQLRPEADYDPEHIRNGIAKVDHFAMEAERKRAMIEYGESPTVTCILIPFFLSAYYSCKQKRLTSAILLREAVTLCELLKLGKETAYASLNPREARYRRRVFWLLFVTEHATAIRYNLATVLRNTIDLPNLEDETDPVVMAGFSNLVRLFVAVDGVLVKGYLDHESQPINMETISKLQQQLQQTPELPHYIEVQRTDFVLTQQW